MRFRSTTAFSLLAAALLLAACDSSNSSPTSDPNDPSHPGGTDSKSNGTLTLGGKTFPVLVGGIYDDTSMMMTVNTDLRVPSDTGWDFILNAKPGKGTVALVKDTATWLGNTASHDPGGSQTACRYKVTAGGIHIDSWTVVSTGQYGSSKMTGGATMTFEPSASTPDCAGATAELTFTDALVGTLGE